MIRVRLDIEIEERATYLSLLWALMNWTRLHRKTAVMIVTAAEDP